LFKALEVFDGDIELFKELVELFLKNVPDNLAQIRDGLAKSDANMIERAAHRLKGSVSNFAATRTFESAYRLELLGWRRD
jgi:HPt (histidine-containing phosphotransfer) domain-containing protein